MTLSRAVSRHAKNSGAREGSRCCEVGNGDGSGLAKIPMWAMGGCVEVLSIFLATDDQGIGGSRVTLDN